MRFLPVLAALALFASTASAQQCSNGQCLRPTQAGYQTITPGLVSAPQETPQAFTAAPERKGLIDRIKENRQARKDARAGMKLVK